MDYILKISGDFEKGDCWECPISYDTTDIYGDYTMRCPVVDCDDCPLEEVEQGEWIIQDETYTKFKCSACETYNHDRPWNFCPNCGADMRGGKE